MMAGMVAYQGLLITKEYLAGSLSYPYTFMAFTTRVYLP